MSRLGIKFINCIGINICCISNNISISNNKYIINRNIYLNFFYVLILGNKIYIYPVKLDKNSSVLWGTYRKIIYNMQYGIITGFKKTIVFDGTENYVINNINNVLLLNVGFSHIVKINISNYIKNEYINKIKYLNIFTFDNILLGQLCYKITNIKKYNCYKLKGIRLLNTFIKQKKIIKR